MKTKSVGAHSICARGSLSCRKRARADMESAPTFLWRAEPPHRGRCPVWSFLPLVENNIRRGAFYMRPRKFILPQAGTGGYGIRPYVFCSGRSPRAEGAKGRVFACCACKRIYFVIFYNSQFTKKTTACRQTKAGGFADILVVSSQRNAKVHYHCFFAVRQRVCRSKILHIEQNAPAMSGKCGETGDF